MYILAYQRISINNTQEINIHEVEYKPLWREPALKRMRRTNLLAGCLTILEGVVFLIERSSKSLIFCISHSQTPETFHLCS